ncbi:TonB-dependent receptor [Novosphingobium colocasiae]|uniref:TonB-dependent receptor n=1 Tax=Novosphingobium colocasiae TaxID=1256513 RepID=A0A918PJU1_9SPHN|nr:TonB-dependent receptor [Novosphingobium colocasiae]
MAALAVALGVAGAPVAWAQDTPPQDAAEAAQPANDIVVTGSRIQRSGFDTPTPVTAIAAEALTKAAPSNLPDALNQLPQFKNSQSPASRERITVNSQVQVGNFLNLRGLQPQRTLVLLDGVRVPPTAPNGAVSIDTLPQALVQRVDVVTGGASAVYGSDAVVGVVNFVLNKKFTGLQLTAQNGISTYGDAHSYKLGATGGLSLMDDRLHILASVERNSSGKVSRFDKRPLAKAGKNYCTIGTGTEASPYTLLEGCHSQIATYGGLIGGTATPAALKGKQFLPDGTIAAFNPGGAGGVGGDGAVLPTSQDLIAPLETWQTFGRIAYEFSPAISAHVQGSWSEAVNGRYDHGATVLTGGTAQGLIIQSDNYFLRPEVRALMTPGSTFTLGRWVDPEVAKAMGKNDLPIPTTKQTSRSLMLNAGLEGSIGGSWKWDANYVHGETKFHSDTHEVNMLKLFAAVDSVNDGAGNPVCRVSITNPGLYPGCVAFNPFGVGAPSDEAIDYVFAHSIWSVKNRMDSGSVNLTGKLFNTWAGPVSVAVGGEIRKQSLLQTSNADPGVPIDLTGLRGLPAFPVRFNTVNVGSAKGSVNVKELYGEIEVPLARDMPFLKSLNVSGAARYTDYSTSGGVTTWKLGADYQPFSDLRLRITKSRDIRAPSLYDLFAGDQQSLRVIVDPHTGVSKPVISVVTGNNTLTPEIGNTLTFGGVYRPSWLPGLGLSVDAYDIKIKDAITSIDPVVALQSCEDSGGTGPTCSLIDRPLPFSDHSADNFPNSITQLPINVATLRQRGIDFELNYALDAAELIPGANGKFQVHGLLSHIYDFKTDLGLNQPIQQSAGYRTIPKWSGSVSVSYDSEKFGIFIQERFTGSYKMALYKRLDTGADGQHFANADHAPNIGYTDVTITARPLADNPRAELFLTINNLFNAKAPVLFPSAANSVNLYYPTVRSTYDIMGRYFTAGVRVKL